MSRNQQVALGAILLLVLALLPTGATLLDVIDTALVVPLVLLPFAFVYLYKLIEPGPATDGPQAIAVSPC